MAPLYDYLCQKCGIIEEIEQKITDEPLSICPKCEKSSVIRLISTTNFSLKGKRWAKDGYSGSNTKNNK